MDDMCTRFQSRFALTVEECTEVVVDSKEVAAIRISRWLLVGKLLADKSFNKESFKRTLGSLWRPKARVTIVEIEHGLFSFAFPTKGERDKVLAGGPWLFDGFLLVLAVADGAVNPYKLALTNQEFWIQVKGLPLAFMTRKMGSIIGSALGDYIVTDQSKKNERLGSYLRIRVSIDVDKPLRRSLRLRLDGEPIEVDIRYEKLPVTCFWCGMIGHSEGTCSTQPPTNTDDLQKPYGQWFQHDILQPDYMRQNGRRFGLPPERHWSVRASSPSVSDSADGTTTSPAASVTTGLDTNPNSNCIPDSVNLGNDRIPVLPDLNCAVSQTMGPPTNLELNWG